MKMYHTDSFKDEHRIKKMHGVGQFDRCEFCGNEQVPLSSDELYKAKFAKSCNTEYYHHHKLILCDRCVDKLNSLMNGRDADEYWEPQDAKRDGFPPFPYEKAKTMTWDKDWRNECE